MKSVEDYDLFKTAHKVNISLAGLRKQSEDSLVRMLAEETLRFGTGVNGALLEGGYGGKQMFRLKLDEAYGLINRMKYNAMLMKELGVKAGGLEEDIVNVSKMISGLRNKIDRDEQE